MYLYISHNIHGPTNQIEFHQGLDHISKNDDVASIVNEQETLFSITFQDNGTRLRCSLHWLEVLLMRITIKKNYL